LPRLLLCECSLLLDHAFVFYILNSQALAAKRVVYMAAPGAL
jgi:hypothetical protein